MKNSLKWLVALLLVPVAGFLIYSFASSIHHSADENTGPFELPDGFNNYWNQGKGELSGYDLQQARYGEVHQGDAVLVFVSEDFSPKSLTKADGAGPRIPVLKVNFDKKFLTGIYPYSMLMTVASPVEIRKHPRALKVATSSQEWCGHTYTQFNFREGNYEMEEHSYFPKEGDTEGKWKAGWLEDEVWTRLRIDPEELPVGELEMVPGTFYLRLRHQEIAPRKVLASREPVPGVEGEMLYRLEYPKDQRRLAIRYETEFPHRVLGWEESCKSGFGPGAKELTTKATLRNTILLDYWNHNGNQDRQLREQLGF